MKYEHLLSVKSACVWVNNSVSGEDESYAPKYTQVAFQIETYSLYECTVKGMEAAEATPYIVHYVSIWDWAKRNWEKRAFRPDEELEEV